MNKNKVLKICTEYCSGCGLCCSVAGVKMKTDSKGFNYPELKSDDVNLCEEVCPAMGRSLNKFADGTIWGKIKKSYLGYSNNDSIRFGASSGGILTTLCVYLIENTLVDGIIQTKKDPKDNRKTITVVSHTKEEIVECMGSRYTTSSPLMEIKQLVEPNKKYAFVGKPCDASALRMYKESNKDDWSRNVIYIFSFFCAGQPSIDANNKLLKTLNCDDISDCKDLQYRGNGWPGVAKVTKKDNSERYLDYETSWMKILGRDVRRLCRFCADGTGETADISCGDAWYLDDNGKPDFTDRPGRNVIFARTQKGEDLINMAIKDCVISVQDFDPYKDKLKLMQPYHYARKASLSSLKLAMKVCFRNFPNYSSKKLALFAKDFSLKSKIYRCVGTIQRVLKKKI